MPRVARTTTQPAAPPVVLPPGAAQPWLSLIGCRHNNLRGVDAHFPLGRLIAVTGVSGSGKSSLVVDILKARLERDLNHADIEPGQHDAILGAEHLDKCIAIDQTPIGRTPRSNPATYTKLFDLIRDLFAELPESRARGYKPGRFSFNVAHDAETGLGPRAEATDRAEPAPDSAEPGSQPEPEQPPRRGRRPAGSPGGAAGGRCPHCQGNGALKLDMDFLADVWQPCPVCNGARFTTETCEVRFKDHSISDVLDLEVADALELFHSHPKIHRVLRTLHDVGLDYIKLGQPAPTLSGGEAQRVKLARELGRPDTGRTLYILDEPTTGLHFEDVRKLLDVLQRLVDHGNTVLVIEHQLDVVKCADWVIDLGPEGGDAGGSIVVAGTPEDVADCPHSHTGQALRPLLGRPALKGVDRPAAADTQRQRAAALAPVSVADAIRVRGASENNLQHVDVDLPRAAMTVVCGLSGSGKSTLAFDTIYAEGQRRYVESLSSYARQFLGPQGKPRFTSITGLSPAIAIEQKNTTRSPRSTVGTVTEIHDYMRVLWARIGRQYCPDHPHQQAIQHNVEQVCQTISAQLARNPGVKLITGPLQPLEGETVEHALQRISQAGYNRILLRGQSLTLDKPDRQLLEAWEDVRVVFDRVSAKASHARIAESVERAWRLCNGWVILQNPPPGNGNNPPTSANPPTDSNEQWFGAQWHCPICRERFEPISPHQFSFNAAIGWCPACQGLGTQRGADASAFIVRPHRPILSGAVQGWGVVPADSMLGRMITAVLSDIGVEPGAAWWDWPPDAQYRFLHGLGDRWINLPQPPRSAQSSNAGSGQQPCANHAIQWKGLFPAVDAITRASWSYRGRLSHLLTDVPCKVCNGSRLNRVSSAVAITGADGAPLALPAACELDLLQARTWFDTLRLPGELDQHCGEILREMRSRLRFLVDVGLGYITLARNTATLSGGEMQRVQLASQVGSGLTGVLYVLDEPTIGLHPSDNDRLINALKHLRDAGNTLLVVEHDEDVIANADHVVELGPGAGRDGGHAVAQGSVQQLRQADSLTGRYLSGRAAVPLPARRREIDVGSSFGWLHIKGAAAHNLKHVDVSLPLGRLVGLTGVSGSGKSSLVESVLWPVLANKLNHAGLTPGPYKAIFGTEQLLRCSLVDQSPIGLTPASTPATFVGVYDLIRELYARLPEARVRGWGPGRFSFNKPGGRCEHCEGNGQRRIEMHFLPDVWVTCEHCNGTRFAPETLDVRFRGKTIADVLNLRVTEAIELFDASRRIRQPLELLRDVGLGYLTLGQPASTLSGGEAQRVKLAAELKGAAVVPGTERHGPQATSRGNFYLLDEPTTGLHFEDVRLLINVLQRLVHLGHSVLVIEHNLDVIKSADWVIELGPGPGRLGGEIVAVGTPEEVAAGNSPTAHYLRQALQRSPRESAEPPAPTADPHAESETPASTPSQQTQLPVPPTLSPAPDPAQTRLERFIALGRENRTAGRPGPKRARPTLDADPATPTPDPDPDPTQPDPEALAPDADLAPAPLALRRKRPSTKPARRAAAAPDSTTRAEPSPPASPTPAAALAPDRLADHAHAARKRLALRGKPPVWSADDLLSLFQLVLKAFPAAPMSLSDAGVLVVHPAADHTIRVLYNSPAELALSFWLPKTLDLQPHIARVVPASLTITPADHQNVYFLPLKKFGEIHQPSALAVFQAIRSLP